jgi:hypothetical protein
MSSPLTVVFYISGHGFGHATRSIEVARQMPADARIIFKSTAVRWLFENYWDRPLEYYPVSLDVGTIQQDSLTLDADRTLEAYAGLLQRAPRLMEEEVSFLKQEQVDAVYADIPPLAFDIAHRAGLPSVGMTNFSWDWIYAPYIEQRPGYQWLIDSIRESYSKCTLLLRLPFHGDLSAFPRTVDIPMVVRKPLGRPAEVRKQFGLGEDKKIVLLSFGGFDVDRLPWDRVREMEDYRFVYFKNTVPAENVIHVPNGIAPHVDIVQAVDIVMTKPGYGITSECLETDTPVVYTDRGEFPEYAKLVSALEKWGRPVYIPQKDLLSGDWKPSLDKAAELPPAAGRHPDSDGAAQAAERIVALCQAAG